MITLMYFGATWCGPCKSLSSIIDDIEVERADIKVVRVNAETDRHTVFKHIVRSVPTVLLLKDDVEVDRIVDLKAKGELIERINNVI